MKFILLLIYLNITYAFINNINRIKTMISSTAILSTISNKLNKEILNDNTMLQLLHTHYKLEFVYLGLIATTLLSNYNIKTNINRKLYTINTFYNSKRITNTLFIIFMIIFFRDIENAI